MKKTGKAGLGHHTKLEKISKQLAAGRAVLAAREEAARKTVRTKKYCG